MIRKIKITFNPAKHKPNELFDWLRNELDNAKIETKLVLKKLTRTKKHDIGK